MNNLVFAITAITVCFLQKRCKVCQQEFKNVTYLRQHEEQCIERRTCKHCHTVCLSTKELTKHLKVCDKAQHTCKICGKVCVNARAVRRHEQNCRKRRITMGDLEPKRQKLICRKCGHVCDDRRQLVRHHTSQHGNANNLQNFTLETEIDDGLRQEYDINRSHILAPHRQSANGAVYNFPTNNLDGGLDELRRHLTTIYDQESNAWGYASRLRFGQTAIPG